MIIKGKKIVLEDKIINDTCIEIDSEIFSKIGFDSDKVDIDLSKYTLISGLIDSHIHGGNGFDTMDGTVEALENLSQYKIFEGVTSFCPTTVTTDIDNTLKAINAVSEAKKSEKLGAKIIGTFLEGPFIATKYKGAHPEEKIKDIDLNIIKNLIENNDITSFAIAPEKEGAIAAIDYLKNNNINVRIGHSGATSAITKDAINKGSNIAIHTFNAMRPFNHREIGIIGEVLINDNIYAEFICDFVHTSEGAARLFFNAKPYDKIILITDCMAAGGLCDGKYMLGELDVIVKDGVAKTLDGTIAGSTLRLIDSVKNVTTKFNIPLHEVVKMASLNPARALGLDDKIGSIKINKKADLVAIDDGFNVVFVIINGKVVLDRR